MKKIFPYGTHIYREPSRPLVELKKDMRIIENLGFNMVKIQESWALDEQQEGRINFSKVEKLISEAEELDLVVYFGVTMEQAPAWLWKKYPDCCPVYNTGEPHNDSTQYLLPADGKPGPCWDHLGAREAGERFITTLAKKLGKYKNIIAWNIWQEVGFRPIRPGMLGFCYCPYTLANFRNWLKEKYGNLEKLNHTWRTGYGKWDEIEPPRNFAAVPSWIDWRYFMDDVYLPQAIRWKVEAFKRNDPLRRPVFCHMGAPIIGRVAEWRFAKEVDFFGSSCYPAWGTISSWDKGYPKSGESIPKEESLKAEMWNSISLKFDYIRSVCKGKECWAAEFQGGPFSSFLRKGRVPAPEDIRRWVLTALSSGINGLCFWNHRAEIFWQEGYGFGLLNSKGNSSPRAEEAARIGKAINRYSNLFREGKVPKARVAILINENLWHFTGATGEASKHLIHTIRGIYKMLWESGIWVDFVETSEIKRDRLKGHKVIILPFPLAISDELMSQLKDYVTNGGVLISEACPGRYDEYGFAHTGELNEGTQELFGIEHKTLTLCHEPGEPHWMPIERSYGEIIPSTRFSGTGPFKGKSVLPSVYVETFILKGANAILLDKNDVTGVVNSYGKGKGYLIGTFLGHAGLTYNDLPTRDFLVKLLIDSGIKPERLGKLLLRRHILNDKEAWFLINPTGETISENVNFTGFSEVENLLEGHVNKNRPIEVTSFSVRVIILQH